MLRFELEQEERCWIVVSCFVAERHFLCLIYQLVIMMLFFLDASSDFPHFSSPELVNKYAVMERLDFLYYLHHGRPSFAFGTFLVQQLAKSKSPKQL